MVGPKEGFLRACQEGNVELIKRFLEEDPNLVNARDENGISGFLQALYHRQKKVAAVLLVYGAELDVFEAAAIGNWGLLEKYLEKIPDLVRSYSNDGWTPLHLSAFFGHAPTSKFLLEHGADPMAISKNPLENTPVHAACSGSHAEVLQVLLPAMTNPNLLCKGYAPLHLSAANGDLKSVSLLVDKGADVNLQSGDGKTPLKFAQEKKQEEVVKYLVGHGAV